MTFLLPIGLLALLTLPLIAILHLVRQRRTRVKVPTTALWQSLRIPPERRQRTLPLTLLLLLHLLVALCLALALANPALLPFGQHTPTHTVIMLDTTTSMAATDVSPSRFAGAQAAAVEILDSLAEGDTVALVALSATPRLLAVGGAADAARLATIVRGLAPAGNGANLAAALHIANSTLSSQQQNQVVVLTDVALSAPTTPLSVAAALDWRTAGGVAENAAIVAFASRRLPTGETALYGRVANFSPNLTVRSLQLLVDGQLSDEQTIRIPAGGTEERIWRIKAGVRAELRLIGADDLPLDDQASLPLERSRSVRVRLISADETALERVLAALPGLNVTVASQFDPAAAPVDVTVLNGVLPDPLPAGALLVVNPPPGDPRLPLAATTLGERASSATLDPAFGGIDLSSVQWGGRHPLAGELSAFQSAITTEQNRALVLRGTLESQPAVVWAFDVDASNLPAKLGFPLLTAASLNVLTTGALPPTLPPGAAAPSVGLLGPDGAALGENVRLTSPGLYTLRAEAGQAQSGGVAVNFGDTSESNLAQQPQPAIMATPADLAIAPLQKAGWRIWPLLLVLALVVLAGEWWYVHAARG
jgi:hypothetical protein